MFDGDMDEGPETEEERKMAAALRRALSTDEEDNDGGEGALGADSQEESKERLWLLAHLRLPTEKDILGDLKARGLARSARELVGKNKAQEAGKREWRRPWQKLSRSAFGTLGLLSVAVLLVVGSSVLFDGRKGRSGKPTPDPEATVTSILIRESFKRREDPATRLDLLIEGRLGQLRQNGYRRTQARGPASFGLGATLPLSFGVGDGK